MLEPSGRMARKTKSVGADRDSFEIEEPIPVSIKKTVRSRILEFALTVIAALIAITISQTLILPALN
ncbi:hypothetical protein LCM28_25575 [Salipiger pacificus]|nr:hypothetical protein [Alloyangia pacifica]